MYIQSLNDGDNSDSPNIETFKQILIYRDVCTAIVILYIWSLLFQTLNFYK